MHKVKEIHQVSFVKRRASYCFFVTYFRNMEITTIILLCKKQNK